MGGKSIYVECRIRADMERLWSHTQQPELHREWDLRFSDITYIAKTLPEEPQRFLYETRIGLGLRIRGEGVSGAAAMNDGERVSALRFGSEQAISLIRAGAGFWKYVQTDDGIRFFTRYEYDVRYGRLGRAFDRLVFRPLIGWATAWSFDALRLWLERGQHPRQSIMRAWIDAVCSWTLMLIWLYQGIVPKLLFPWSGELAIMQSAGVFPGWERTALLLLGLVESAAGVLFMFVPQHLRKRLYMWSIPLLLVLAIGAAGAPVVYVQPFNPVTLTFAMIGLALVGWLNSGDDVPSALRCARRPPNRDLKGKGPDDEDEVDL